MKKFLLTLLVASTLLSCHFHSLTLPMSPSKVRSYSDLLEIFPLLHLPYHLAEDSLGQTGPDSLAIPATVMKAYFPDTLGKGIFRHPEDMAYYPIGRFHDANLDYLLVRVTSLRWKGALLCLFSSTGVFRTRLLVGQLPSKGVNTLITTQLDKAFNITVSEERSIGSGRTALREMVYGANTNGTLALILVNSNEPLNPEQLYNPIDSLPKTRRFSGDYTAGRMNLVSIRDGRNAGGFHFFIHFSKDRGNCTGEIAGTASWQGQDVAHFQETAGPCAIQLSFSGDKVTLDEIGSCAAYRGMSCEFSGTFMKKKTTRKKKSKK